MSKPVIHLIESASFLHETSLANIAVRNGASTELLVPLTPIHFQRLLSSQTAPPPLVGSPLCYACSASWC